MLHDVITASYKDCYQIELTFDDGAHGVVDFSPYLQRGGVFTRFRDIAFFREFRVDPELGTLTWPDEIDVAPETLYAQATGLPLPDWMMPEEAFS
jgi:hypothetical protein